VRVHWARNQAEQLVGRLGIRAPHIDPIKVAKALGLEVVTEDLGSDVAGLLVRRGEQAVIAVHRGDPANRRNFTVAHEIGHHVLGHQFEPGEHVHVDRGHFISQRGPRSSAGVDPKEVEANQFAAALLMPSDLVRDAAQRLGLPLMDSDVSQLSRLFRVSDQAMTIRLSALGLL
jgi:Zn-dependent peptidase ImmA (M78 family)